MLDVKLISIIQHNERQNGSIDKLKAEAEKCKDHRKKVGWAERNWKPLLGVGLVLLYLFHSVVEYISLPKLISLIFN